jgi:hypothetical protein
VNQFRCPVLTAATVVALTHAWVNEQNEERVHAMRDSETNTPAIADYSLQLCVRMTGFNLYEKYLIQSTSRFLAVVFVILLCILIHKAL